MTAPREVSSNLWARISLEARARARSNEPAHDFFHVERVVANALAIARGEGLGGCRKKVG